MLTVNDLSVNFKISLGRVEAVKHAGFSIKSGETLGIVGESGSGKSVMSMAIMGLLRRNQTAGVSGEIWFSEKNLLTESEEAMRQIRGNRITMVFQEPMISLNPIHTCGRQVTEPLILHKGYSKRDAFDRGVELMDRVGIPLPERRMREFPFQLSGGMRQRVMIAMALACEPMLLIADEPTTALDVTIQAQILELMKDLRTRTRTAIMMITHDLGVIAEMSDRVMVLYAGQVMEIASVRDLFHSPSHPYTCGLLESIPRVSEEKKALYAIEGTVPNPTHMIAGCVFHPRCSRAEAICKEQTPELLDLGGGHHTRCIYNE